MPSAPWLVALVSISVGPLAALEGPREWFFSTEMVVEKSEVPSPKPQFRGEEDEPLPGPGATETLQGHAYFWGFSEFRFDLYSWIGPAWFSTPGQAGSLSSTGGWGLYALDKIGVLACGDFWPWVGWGVLIVPSMWPSRYAVRSGRC